VNVTPVFKKGYRSLAENYRPVSITSQIRRLFERIIIKVSSEILWYIFWKKTV